MPSVHAVCVADDDAPGIPPIICAKPGGNCPCRRPYRRAFQHRARRAAFRRRLDQRPAFRQRRTARLRRCGHAALAHLAEQNGEWVLIAKELREDLLRLAARGAAAAHAALVEAILAKLIDQYPAGGFSLFERTA